MRNSVDSNSSSAITRHTIFGRLYNRATKTVDRIMPTGLYLQNMRAEHSKTFGVRSYDTPPITTRTLEYQGRFAIADLVPIERPLPWERIIK